MSIVSAYVCAVSVIVGMGIESSPNACATSPILTRDWNTSLTFSGLRRMNGPLSSDAVSREMDSTYMRIWRKARGVDGDR